MHIHQTKIGETEDKIPLISCIIQIKEENMEDKQNKIARLSKDLIYNPKTKQVWVPAKWLVANGIKLLNKDIMDRELFSAWYIVHKDTMNRILQEINQVTFEELNIKRKS